MLVPLHQFVDEAEVRLNDDVEPARTNEAAKKVLVRCLHITLSAFRFPLQTHEEEDERERERES